MNKEPEKDRAANKTETKSGPGARHRCPPSDHPPPASKKRAALLCHQQSSPVNPLLNGSKPEQTDDHKAKIAGKKECVKEAVWEVHCHFEKGNGPIGSCEEENCSFAKITGRGVVGISPQYYAVGQSLMPSEDHLEITNAGLSVERAGTAAGQGFRIPWPLTDCGSSTDIATLAAKTGLCEPALMLATILFCLRFATHRDNRCWGIVDASGRAFRFYTLDGEPRGILNGGDINWAIGLGVTRGASRKNVILIVSGELDYLAAIQALVRVRRVDVLPVVCLRQDLWLGHETIAAIGGRPCLIWTGGNGCVLESARTLGRRLRESGSRVRVVDTGHREGVLGWLLSGKSDEDIRQALDLDGEDSAS